MLPNIVLIKAHNKQQPTHRPLTRAHGRSYQAPPDTTNKECPIDNNGQQSTRWAPSDQPTLPTTTKITLMPTVATNTSTSTITTAFWAPEPPISLSETQLDMDNQQQQDVCVTPAQDCCGDGCCERFSLASRILLQQQQQLQQQTKGLLNTSCSCLDDNCYDPLLSANPHDHPIPDHNYSPVKVSSSYKTIGSDGYHNNNNNKENHHIARLPSSESSSSIVSQCSLSSSMPLHTVDIVKRIREWDLDLVTSQSVSPSINCCPTRQPLHQKARNDELHNGNHDSDESEFSMVSSVSTHAWLDDDLASPNISAYLDFGANLTQTSSIATNNNNNSPNNEDIYVFKDDDNCSDGNVNIDDNRITSTSSSDAIGWTGNIENRELVKQSNISKRTYMRSNLRSGSKPRTSDTNNRDKKHLKQQRPQQHGTVYCENLICVPGLKSSLKRKREADSLCDLGTVSDARKKRKKTPEQLAKLETIYDMFGGATITKEKRLEIAQSLDLHPEEVRCWFKYKRSRRCQKRMSTK